MKYYCWEVIILNIFGIFVFLGDIGFVVLLFVYGKEGVLKFIWDVYLLILWEIIDYRENIKVFFIFYGI